MVAFPFQKVMQECCDRVFDNMLEKCFGDKKPVEFYEEFKVIREYHQRLVAKDYDISDKKARDNAEARVSSSMNRSLMRLHKNLWERNLLTFDEIIFVNIESRQQFISENKQKLIERGEMTARIERVEVSNDVIDLTSKSSTD